MKFKARYIGLLLLTGVTIWLGPDVAAMIKGQIPPAALPNGIWAPGEPQQADVARRELPLKGYKIGLLARYDITARLISRHYYWVDRESELAPFDFAVGWGQMSGNEMLSQVEIKQSIRFYWWRPVSDRLDTALLTKSSANMHLIPASNRVWRQLAALPAGSIIHLKGYLVEATAPDGWTWHSSMTRDDTGKGACELMLVTEAERVR